MKYFIGLDIGTSSVKGVLMEEGGKIKTSAKAVFQYRKPQPGFAELVPSEYLDACLGVIRQLAAEASEGQVSAICAASASGNLILVDKEGRPLTGIISWQDQRVSDEAREILGEMDTDDLYEQIGWPFDFQTFPLAQLCYIKKHQPELLKQCGKVCMSTEYLYYILTGKWGISTSAGTPFYLINQKEGRYIEELLRAFDLEEGQVPPILPCGSILGGVQAEIAAACGVTAGTPVVLGTFDHPSAARGVGVLEEGEMLLSCGTSWVVFMPVSHREKGIAAKGLVDPFLSPQGNWAVMASVTSLSERIRLYMHRYIGDGEDCFRKLSALAGQSVFGAHGLHINMLEEPEDARIRSYPQEDVARAIMEGTVNMLKQSLDKLKVQGITAEKAVMAGGPSEDPMWRILIEEICGISVRVVHGANAGAVGAAVLAGIGTGAYRDEKAAKDLLQEQ